MAANNDCQELKNEIKISKVFIEDKILFCLRNILEETILTFFKQVFFRTLSAYR